MHSRVSGLLIVMAVSVLFGSSVQLSVAASFCTIDEQERAALTTVLIEVSKHSRSVMVVQSETDSSHFATEFSLHNLLLQDEASEMLPKLRAAPSGSTVALSPTPVISDAQQHELEQEYKAKLKSPCTIPQLSSDLRSLVFRSPREVSKIFSGSDPSKGWSRFHHVFGNDAELVTLSRAAFDRAKQYALVQVSSGISQDGGGGELYLLTQLNGSWIVRRVFETWTT